MGIRPGYAQNSVHLRMEDSMLYSLLCFFFVILVIKFLLPRRNKQKNLPPSPPSLPIIGHLHLLKQPVHRSFDNLSQKYGPIFSLKLGSRLVVVVSSPSAVEECFTKNDIVFANRPVFPSGKYLTYNYTTVASAKYGEHWRNLRRICALQIFSSSRLNNFLDIRRDEVQLLLRRLYQLSRYGFAKVELRSMFMDLASNIIMRMVAGKRYYGEDLTGNEEARQFRETVQEFFKCLEVSNLGDFIPILHRVDFDGHVKRVMRIGEKLDLFLQGLIDEHRDNKDRNTMINHLLTLQESQPEYYTDEIIKGLIQVMLLAGIETSSSSLEWAISNLLNHPNVLNKAKEELDTQVGQGHLIDESDFPKLHYLQSIISENLRLYPVLPLLVPHYSSTDCTVEGYNVPQDTMLFVNAWAIQRDSKLWDDPMSFKPERFERGKVEAYKLIPFGSGRRACPGDGLANRVIALTLGSLIQCFEWRRTSEKKIDMTDKGDVTVSRVEPLEVLCKARLPIANVVFS